MKIKELLEKHPWPWAWDSFFLVIFDANRVPVVLVNGMSGNKEVALAFLEFVELYATKRFAIKGDPGYSGPFEFDPNDL